MSDGVTAVALEEQGAEGAFLGDEGGAGEIGDRKGRAREDAGLAHVGADDEAQAQLTRAAHDFDRTQQPAHLGDAHVHDPGRAIPAEGFELSRAQCALVEDDPRAERARHRPHAIVVPGCERLLDREERKLQRAKVRDGRVRVTPKIVGIGAYRARRDIGSRQRLDLREVASAIAGGPLQRFFEARVQAQFFDSSFHGPGELRFVVHAGLSPRSNRLLQSRMKKLAEDFDALADDDRREDHKTLSGTTMVIAIRPWELGLFTTLRRERN